MPDGEVRVDQVKTVKSDGSPVVERITSIEAARDVYRQLVEAESTETIRRRRLKGMIDGAPPFNADKLRELGMGNRLNVNFLEARAILDAKASAYFELFFEVPTLIEATLRTMLPDRTPGEVASWCNIVSEEFTRVVLGWPGFLTQMDIARRQSDAYGFGGATWRNPWDWRPRAFQRGSFKPDPMATLDPSDMSRFALDDQYTVGELWAIIKNESSAERQGWNPGAVKRALVRKYRDQNKQLSDDRNPYSTSEWESLQQRARNNDWTIQSVEFQPIKVVHLCVAEADRSVSHYVFLEDSEPTFDSFLCRKPAEYRSMSEALWLLPYNNGDGYLRSCRGLASMIEPHCDLSNRFLCHVFDAGFLTGSLILQPTSATDLTNLSLVRMGPVTLIPAGTEALQTSFTPKLTELVQLRDLSSSIMKNNTGVFRQNPELFMEKQAQKTARQVVEEVARESRMEKANVAFDYYQFDQLYTRMFRRMTRPEYLFSSVPHGGQDEAKDFVRRCAERGVPVDLLLANDLWEVQATRAIGMGSWGVKLDVTKQLMEIRGTLDVQGQYEALRQFLGVRVGWRNVDRYRPPVDRGQIPSDAHSMAILENNDMSEGAPTIVGSDQIHRIHESVHRALLEQLAQAGQDPRVLDQIDPRKALVSLRPLLPHYQQTLQYMSADPAQKPILEAGIELIKAAVEALKAISKKASDIAEQEARLEADKQGMLMDAMGQSASREDQLKALEIVKKAENERIKQESLNAARKQKTDEQMAIRRHQAEEDIRLKAQRQAAEIEIKRIEAQAKIDIDKMRSAGVVGEAGPGGAPAA